MLDNNLVQNILKKNPKTRFNEIYELCGKVKRCGEHNIDGCDDEVHPLKNKFSLLGSFFRFNHSFFIQQIGYPRWYLEYQYFPHWYIRIN